MSLLDDVLNEDTTINWHTEIDGKLTFLGVMTHYYEAVISPWNKNTQKSYFRDYRRYILPDLNDKPLEDYTKEDFEAIFAVLSERKKKNNQVYHEGVVRHFWYIVNHVLKIASKNNICPNVLWGSEEILEDSDEEKINEKELVRLRKSLTIVEELSIAELTLSDPKQSGQRIGIALMFCLGLRNGEACGADWKDIHPMECDPDMSYLLVYKSTKNGSNIQKYGGKTGNAGRMVPIPAKLKILLDLRRAWLMEKAEKGEIPGCSVEELGNLPIACEGSNFTKRCSARLLTKEGTTVLEKIGMDGDTISFINRDIRLDKEGILEKDPTAYLFRRNLGTHLYHLGLSESETQYIMGHAIEENGEMRSSFRNEEKLYPIAKKMAQRPIVNDVLESTEEIAIEGKTFYGKGLCKDELKIPIKTRTRLRIKVSQQEPSSKMRLEIIPENLTIQGTHTQHQNYTDYEKTLTIMGQYHQRYREIKAHWEKKKEMADFSVQE